jgi:hypothetical protein
MKRSPPTRVFKTAWFSRAAKKAVITDMQLCSAIEQVMAGQADDLGGGVYKKRLGKNLYRSVVLARGRRHWIYAYLFAKRNRANIDEAELAAFRALALVYAAKTDSQFNQEVLAKEVVEICL